MKNLGLLFAFTCIRLLAVKIMSEKIDEVLKVPEKPISVGCYQAIYEDTLDLKINTFKNGEVTGDMDMAISNMPSWLENFAVIRYSPAILLFKVAIKKKHIKIQWHFKARRRSYFRQRLQITLELHILLMTQP
jgi:hypothetical protein